jgi:hypothetical protein
VADEQPQLAHVGVNALTPLSFAEDRSDIPRFGSDPSRDAMPVIGRETPLEAARRHVREGARRVARQEGIVAMLDKDANYRPQAALAREILASLHASLYVMNSRLQAIEDRSKS